MESRFVEDRGGMTEKLHREGATTDSPDIALPHGHRVVLDLFVVACQADERVVAAFLNGSFARGAADEYSDLDLGVITTDSGYDDFRSGCEAFVRQLGEPLFLEDFDLPDAVFFILPGCIEAEIWLGREDRLQQFPGGPYTVLLDKNGVLSEPVAEGESPRDRQVETLRRAVYWFWHDLSHFTAAMGRGQLWWAYGQLEEVRGHCVNLARLRQDFSAPADGYEKLDTVVPAGELAALRSTYCPFEQRAMLDAANVIVGFYRKLAVPLAQMHGIAYPADLDRVMSARLAKLVADRQ
jgi:Streptomycin adenylyltransferase/Nucleotidyltransferase domain